MKRNYKLRYLGNLFVICGLFIIVYIYYPIALTYLIPPKINNHITKGIYITIPKISAQAPIELNVNPWNSQEYLEKLKIGVAHAKGTVLPGSKGTSFIFAHSSGSPLDISRYNTVFLRLGELQIGDIIEISDNGKKIIYKVSSKKEVWPKEVSFLKDLSKNQLILQTCTPIGTDFKRLLIFAVPI